MLCPALGNEHSHAELSVLDVTSTASGKESEICGLCLICDALRIVNVFTQKHAQACAPTHKHTHTHTQRESRATSVKGTCRESDPCHLAHTTNRVLRYGARRLFNTAFFIFKYHKISRHTRKCNFIYTHIEFTAFLTPSFTKSITFH